jgi:hypothetical protein
MKEPRERQQPNTGLNGPSPSKHQRRIMKKLQARVDGFERIKDKGGYHQPGSHNPSK